MPVIAELRAFRDRLRVTIIEGFINHGQRLAAKRASKIRELQEQEGREQGKTTRMVIYEQNVHLGDGNGQGKVTFVVKGEAGNLTRLPADAHADITAITDFPTLCGLTSGKYTRVLRDGTKETIEPFGATDAVAMGNLKWQGRTGGLKEILLLENQAPFLLRLFDEHGDPLED